jgi:sec-independent protein translocase protein TatC
MIKKRPRKPSNNIELSNIPLKLEDHLNELKNRFLSILLVFIASSLAGFIFREYLLKILIRPMDGPLYYTTPAGGFNFMLSLSICFGVLVTIPFAAYHLALFIRPAQPVNKKIPILLIITASFLLMWLGIFFAYYFSIPAALTFLKSFGPGNINSIITAESYLLFVSMFVLGFGVLFQLPLVMFLINLLVKMHVKSLFRAQKWVVLAAFVLAAIITPTPDIINQVMMAIPIVILYQISVLTVYITNRRVDSHSHPII